MSKLQKIVTALLALVLCAIFVFSIIDTNEIRRQTNFSQANITTHIEKLSENGPRSLVHTEANKKAMEYIVAQAEAFGAVEGDRTDVPAYMIQDYVAVDETGRYQNFYLQNVIVHIPANAEDKSGDAIMFMGHFDSVPMGQGASDDGVACSVMLEAIRYYTEKMAEGYTLKNDLVFCFVNGEEYNLYGSRAFMNEFTGFDNILDRIKFGVNLESRGTSGTEIMFETAANNYNTIKLFAEVNKNIFTCSIATLIYDTMPNSTDFTNFKDVYQGINMANIGGGENYHTQNDNPQNVGGSYLSQQAQIVDAIIEKLADYDLKKLYEAEESAIFFSYLNVTTVVYNHTAVIILAVIAIILLLLNIVISAKKKSHKLKNTAKAILAFVATLALSAGVTYGLYVLFQYVAVLAGAIDIKMVGTITYSNVPIVIGICLASIAVTAIVSHFAKKWLKIETSDLRRGFAYVHIFLGIVLSFVLPEASYLFIFSGLMFTLCELLATLNKKSEGLHLELLATALYLPVVVPILFLATSALGMTMAYVYGAVCVLALYDAGLWLASLCRYFSVRSLLKAIKKQDAKVSSAEGGLYVLAMSLVILTVVSTSSLNASVNLQGKQNIAKLPSDDALVYVVDEEGDTEYRVYDLNAYGALKAYSPEMTYNEEGYYEGEGESVSVNHAIVSTNDEATISVTKTHENSLVYLDFSNATGKSFIIDDGKTRQSYEFDEEGKFSINIHSNCQVILKDGTADVQYKEVLRDYESLIPAEYDNDSNMLHFNLWLTKELSLKAD